jgi:hypothetical protein
MKQTIMRLCLAVIIMLCYATTTIGQQSANASITGLANVAAQVTVAGTGNLQFGNVTPGNTKTISAAGVVVAGTIGGTTEVEGKFLVTKGANTQVTLAFTLPTDLISGSDNLPINFADFGANKLGNLTDAGSNTAPFTPATGITTANTGSTVWAFGATNIDVHIGGTVVPTAAQPSGAYSGNITLTATYN